MTSHRSTESASAQFWELVCTDCGAVTTPSSTSTPTGRCSRCAATIIARRTQAMSGAIDPRAPGIWRYREWLGLAAGTEWLSLGESMTPLLEHPQLAAQVGVRRLWLKLDSLCATGSFKDRAVASGVEQALRSGAAGIVCASSGNAAASAGAYAARAGLPAILVMPEKTPAGKLASSAAYGVSQVLVPGDYSESFAVAGRIATELGYTNVTTTYANPLAVVGLRSVAYDLVGQLDTHVTAVVIPTSAGPLVHGVAAGYADLCLAELASKVPKLIAAQPVGCSPVAQAFATNAARVQAWPKVTTSVSGLDDPLRGYAGDGTVTLAEVRSSSGAAVAVDDAEVEQAQTVLAHRYGVFAEAAGAISVAALRISVECGYLGADDTVVCLITGHGMKRPGQQPCNPLRFNTVDQLLSDLANDRQRHVRTRLRHG